MESTLKIHLIAYLVRGYDKRDRDKTFEEIVIVSDAGRKSCTFPQSIKDQYHDLGFEVISTSLPDYGETRSVTLDLKKLYDESTDRILKGKEPEIC